MWKIAWAQSDHGSICPAWTRKAAGQTKHLADLCARSGASLGRQLANAVLNWRSFCGQVLDNRGWASDRSTRRIPAQPSIGYLLHNAETLVTWTPVSGPVSSAASPEPAAPKRRLGQELGDY